MSEELDETPETKFKSALRDAIAINAVLARDCKTVEEAIGVAQLALKNGGQLRMLMRAVTQAKS